MASSWFHYKDFITVILYSCGGKFYFTAKVTQVIVFYHYIVTVRKISNDNSTLF